MSSSKKDEMPADVVTGQKYVSHSSSAADEYFRYSLLQEKLKNSGAITPDEKKRIREASSERETIELRILNRLIDVTESSPEFSQLVDITGTRDRYEMARILAEVTYDKMRAESVLQMYTLPKEELQEHFATRTTASLNVRQAGGLAALAGVVSRRSSASAISGGFFGGGGNASASGGVGR